MLLFLRSAICVRSDVPPSLGRGETLTAFQRPRLTGVPGQLNLVTEKKWEKGGLERTKRGGKGKITLPYTAFPRGGPPFFQEPGKTLKKLLGVTRAESTRNPTLGPRAVGRTRTSKALTWTHS